MGKRKNAIRVDFSNGDAAQHVTGSCVHLESDDFSIILECGLSQSNNLRRDYATNREKFKFKTKDVDYVFCMHAHADHCARIPLLYKRGCKATLILPENTSRIYHDMNMDSAHIMQRDAEQLSYFMGKTVEPLYEEKDVQNSIDHIREYPIGEKITLNEHISFRFVPSGHIICGTQLELWLTTGNTTKKIIYTSDLGNNLLEKNYVEKFEPLEKCDLLICETTYGDADRQVANTALRKKDLEKLKTVIDYEVLEKKHRILIPVFALDRLPEILTELYKIYGHDENFNVPILIDTPLGLKHIKTYFNILPEDKKELLTEVFNWYNINQIGDFSESKAWASSRRPYIVLASSGMLTAGRSLVYAENMINDFDSHVIFCGYATEGSISYKIKHPKENKFIDINGKKLRNRCGVTDLHSFSSHMQYPELLKYYSNINCNQVALVHGQMETKIKFAAALRNEYTKKNKTTKVTIINASMVVNI